MFSLGYLTDEGFYRTCSAFQEECSLFENGKSKLDQVACYNDLYGFHFFPNYTVACICDIFTSSLLFLHCYGVFFYFATLLFK